MDKLDNLCTIFDKLNKFLSSDSIVCLPDVQQCLIYKLNYVHQSILNNIRNPEVLLSVQAVLDYLWEDLNTGHWSQVPEKTRTLYALGSLFKVIRIVQEAVLDSDVSHNRLKKAVKAADMGLLMGCGYFEQLSLAAKFLSSFLMNDVIHEGAIPTSSMIAEQGCSDWNFRGISGIRVPSEICPSIESFCSNYFGPQKPVKLKECINHWPALTKWSDPHYLVTVAGPRMIPIEIGSSYTHEDWGMKLMNFEEFMNKYIINKNDKVGYLAQHQLFDQIPELRNDFFIPEYCALSDSDDATEPDINVWFGPAGTVSPLHYDPKHNLLCQILGRKRVILYSPEDSENLYAFDSKMLFNTSNVDPYSPDYEKFPNYKNAKAYECHLYPGQILYIPPKWWHHVRSLDTSFSISFWWE